MNISKKHFEYLVTQRGEVSHERANFSKWKEAYETNLAQIMESISPVLPSKCGLILDIGSGLGGVDVLLAAYYGYKPIVLLVDGEADSPEVHWSFQTHSSREVAFDFQKANSGAEVRYMNPNEFRAAQVARPDKADLIVSFAAYGFHIPPGDYIEELKKWSHKDTVVILEVRRTKPEWLREFVYLMGEPRVLYRAPKIARLAFNVKEILNGRL